MSSCAPDCMCDRCNAATWNARAERLATSLRAANEDYARSLVRVLLPAFERCMLDAQLAVRQRVAASVVTWRDPVLRPWERMPNRDATLLLVGVYFDGPELVLEMLTRRAELQREAQRREVEIRMARHQLGALRS